MTALVVALAGTDHHPFDRLVTWVDAAAVRHPDVRFVVQHGSTTRPPVSPRDTSSSPTTASSPCSRRPSVVVCHGGPGTIMDAREAGHVPLCVPRDPRLGEHVDGHQQRFAAMVGEAGVVRAVAVARGLPSTELDAALGARPVAGRGHHGDPGP